MEWLLDYKDALNFFLIGCLAAIGWQVVEKVLEKLFPAKKRTVNVSVEHKIVPSGVEGSVDVTMSIRNAAVKIEAAIQKGVDKANG